MASLSGAEVDSLHGALDPAALLPALGQLLPARDPGRAVGRTAAAGSSFAVIAGAREVREGRSRVALVADPGGRSAACAVVITAGGGDG
jgi:hypothetical protein